MMNLFEQSEQSARFMVPMLVALNLIPMIGVLFWDWHSFDLIFLYWMENVVIGIFTLVRMIARPYNHFIGAVFPLFFAPFFAVHYGGFTWGHGSFLISQFAPDDIQGGTFLESVLAVVHSEQMLIALGSLMLLHLLDWVRDLYQHGLGADGLKDLMTKPYRRIIVLHITIIGSGFALGALNEPLAGLMLLVVLKTGFDIYHWHKDNKTQSLKVLTTVTPEQLAELEAQYPEPTVKVNGKEVQFDSFADMKASKEYRLAMTVMQLVGGDKQRLMEHYMNSRIEKEKAAQQ